MVCEYLIVNGATGTVIGYAYTTHSKLEAKAIAHLKGSNILAVIVKFDDPEIGNDLKKNFKHDKRMKIDQNAVPIFRFTQSTYPVRFRENVEITVEQFPINLFYASTSHKIQGRTLENQDVVCYTHKWIRPGCAYVMLSRCTKIENVYISKDFDFEKVTPHLPSLKMNNILVKMCMAAILKEKTFDIFYANMRGKSNLINVRYDPFADQSNLVCLVETNMNSNDPTETWPNRRCFPHASMGRGTGVCAYAKQDSDKYHYQFVAKKQYQRFQILQLKMTELKKINFLDVWQDKFQIFILYVSHDQDSSHVANAMKEMILKDIPTIVIGDFNFDSEMEWNSLSNYLKKTLQLQQIVTGPTYLYSKNTIDHIYVPKNLAEQVSQNSRFNYYTDHKSFNITFD